MMIMPDVAVVRCLAAEIEGRVFAWEEALVGELRISGDHVKKEAKLEEVEEGSGELHGEGVR